MCSLCMLFFVPFQVKLSQLKQKKRKQPLGVSSLSHSILLPNSFEGAGEILLEMASSRLEENLAGINRQHRIIQL